MSTNTPSPDDMISSFPHPLLPEVGEDPTYQELVLLRNALKQNYASVITSLGGGDYGYLGGLISAAAYNLLAPYTPFAVPANPGPPPVIETATTVINTGNILRAYAEEARLWKEWSCLERAGKKQLQQALPKALLAGQTCPNRGLNNLKTSEVLEQLFNEWGQVTQQDLVANRNRLHEDWDPSRPFSDLVTRVQEVQEYALDGNRPVGEDDIVDAMYTVIFNTGVYFDDCSDWDDKPSYSKTWAEFKTFFAAAQLRARRRQKATTKMGGFHGNNQVNAVYQGQIEQAEHALINLMTTAAEDKEQMKAKDKIINDQVLLITSLTQQLSAANARILSLQSTRSNRANPQGGSPQGGSPTNIPSPNTFQQTQTWVSGKHKRDKGGYCWTHGFLVDPMTHTSANCWTDKQKPGHQATATRTNTMGGNEYGKPRQ